MRRVVTIVGARPQFIKAAVVSRAFMARPDVSERLIHTGQHYDERMSDIFFSQLGLPEPAWHLGIGSGSHGMQTGRMLEAIETVLVAEKPEWVVVYGDTNSTLAGALAAAKLGIPVAHVEAGLRSFNRAMPEELNRVVTDHLSSLLLAPTTAAMGHLAREGLEGSGCHLVGDVMYDSVVQLAPRARAESRLLDDLGLSPGEYILATLHRAENTESSAQVQALFEGLARASRHLPVVLPVHPRVRALLGVALGDTAGLRVIEPVGYLDMLALEGAARLVVTDSGGVQKEAFFQRVPCLTLRRETEWTELVEAGWNHLVAPESAAIVAEAIAEALARPRPAEPPSPLYGGGAAATTVAALVATTQGSSR